MGADNNWCENPPNVVTIKHETILGRTKIDETSNRWGRDIHDEIPNEEKAPDKITQSMLVKKVLEEEVGGNPAPLNNVAESANRWARDVWGRDMDDGTPNKAITPTKTSQSKLVKRVREVEVEEHPATPKKGHGCSHTVTVMPLFPYLKMSSV